VPYPGQAVYKRRKFKAGSVGAVFLGGKINHAAIAATDVVDLFPFLDFCQFKDLFHRFHRGGDERCSVDERHDRGNQYQDHDRCGIDVEALGRHQVHDDHKAQDQHYGQKKVTEPVFPFI